MTQIQNKHRASDTHTHTQPYLSFATTCLHYQDSTEGSDKFMDENQFVKAEPEQESGYKAR